MSLGRAKLFVAVIRDQIVFIIRIDYFNWKSVSFIVSELELHGLVLTLLYDLLLFVDIDVCLYHFLFLLGCQRW